MRPRTHSRIIVVFAACALSACVSTGRFGRVAEQVVIYPTPPDTARVQFLFSVTSELDVTGRRSEGFLASLLDEPSDVLYIKKPYGVDLFAGRFYVCDSMLPGVVIIDIVERTLRQWQPGGPGELKKPINCTVDPFDGSLYVADTERRQVVVFDAAGEYVGAFGNDLGRPGDVFVDEDRLFVADLDARKVHIYDKSTRTLRSSFPGPGVVPEMRIQQITSLWVQDELVYLVDFAASKVKVYRTDGTPVSAFGSLGQNSGQFIRPKGIAVDRSGIIYVVDAAFDNVQLFDPDGQLLMAFGGGHNGPGGLNLPAQVRVSYENLELFQEYVDPMFELEYLILVTSQYGPNRLNVYGFVRPASRADP